MNELRYGLLGATAVWSGSRAVAVDGSVRRALLTRLLLAGGHPLPGPRLVEDLWGEQSGAGGISTLKSHLSLLRRCLGPNRITHAGTGYVLAFDRAEVDTAAFDADVERGKRALERGGAEPAIAAFRCGLARWRGRALQDVTDRTWATGEAVRLEERRIDALDGLLEAMLLVGDAGGVVAEAEAAVDEHPLQERLWARLVVGLYRSGRQADALRALQRVRHTLAEEIGVAPGTELRELEGAVLRHDPALDGVPRPGELLGMRPGPQVRVPGRTPPAPVRFADLAGLPGGGGATPLIGREGQLEDLVQVVAPGALVTLTGPGGVGKTRMAVEVARRWKAGPVAFVRLAAARRRSQVASQLLAASGARERPGCDPTGQALRMLGTGALVVFDNCEHLLEATAALASDILGRSDGVALVATSRQSLGVQGEVTYRLPALRCPGDETDPLVLQKCPAVQLFVVRAAAHQPGFALRAANAGAVAAVCERLDGLPLAIELAAARMRTMTVEDLDARLGEGIELLAGGPRDVDSRHRSAESALAWSWALLDADAKRVMAVLSVFAGGWVLRAAEDVVAAALPDVTDPLGALLGLVDKSLVERDGTGPAVRYRLHGIVRQYARSHPCAGGDAVLAAARDAHAAVYLRLAESAVPHLVGADLAVWRERLVAERENLRAAFSHVLATATDPNLGLRFVVALSWYWCVTGRYAEGARALSIALSGAGQGAAVALRGEALAAAGHVNFRCGELAAAERYLGEALSVARALDDDRLLADTLRTLAWVAERRGDRVGAAQAAADAVTAAERAGERYLLARAYDVRAATGGGGAEAEGDYERARVLCAALGDSLGLASVLNNLGILCLESDRVRDAGVYFTTALEVGALAGDEALAGYLRYGAGMVAALEDRHDVAYRHFAAALETAWRNGEQSLVAYALAGVACSWPGAPADAAVLLGAAQQLFDLLGEQPETLESQRIATRLGELAAEVGMQLDHALQRGAALPTPAAVRLVATAPV